MKTPEVCLTDIYKHVDRVRITSDVDGVTSKELVYGEITWKGLRELLRHVPAMKGADFVDLGSGDGKVVHYVALKYPVAISRGIEIVPERYDAAMGAHAKVKQTWKHAMAPIEFTLGNFNARSLRKSTHVYACSTCFSDDTMNSIAERMLKHSTPASPKYLITQKTVRSSSRVELLAAVEGIDVTWGSNGVRYNVYVFR